jgi:N-formylmaleamate deformylase
MAWTSGDVVANGLRLHYVRTGGDKPPLVLAHGHSDNGLCWTRVARVLESDYDLTMYDARRHGLSDDGPEVMARNDLAEDAAALIRALGLEKPGMFGHSMGAATAAGVAALYPDLLSYVILEDAPWFDEEARARWQNRPPSQEEPPTTREGWIARCQRQNPNWHPDEVGPWADSKMQFMGREWKSRREGPPWQEVAERITVPALLLTGDLELGAIVSPAVADEALRLMPNAQVAHMPGAGHCIHRDKFEETMAAVQAFLARVKAS